METGIIQYPLSYADLVLDVKKGIYPVKHILEMAKAIEEEGRIAYEKTDLPDKTREEEIHAFVMEETERWLTEE